MKKQNIKGITLIALVITIIVLLILAGVSIVMLSGPNGLLTQAKDAKTKTEEAGAKEKVQIAIAGSWGENGFDAEKFETEVGRFGGKIIAEGEEFPIKVTVNGQNFEVSEEGVVTETGKNTIGGDTVTPGEKVTGSNKTYEKNGTAIIPVGFSIVPGLDDVSQGLVISDDENDTEKDKGHIIANGNQFVWIPVTDSNSYVRNTDYPKDFTETITDDENYLPKLEGIDIPNAMDTEAKKEKYLVTNKGGFYISRYEAGDSSINEDRTSATDGTLVSKRNAYVYNYIVQEDAKAKAKTFINNQNVKSGLITGIQWDMVMKFVNGKKDGNGSDDYIVNEYKSTRHKVDLKQSGQNEADKVCNVYDLEGNCVEWVAERNDASNPYVIHGGASAISYPAAYRSNGYVVATSYTSFRFVLYVI